MDSDDYVKGGILDAIVRWVTFSALVLAALVGPWFFGAWEMWWFWPFVAVIGVAVAFTGVRLALFGPRVMAAVKPRVWIVLLSLVPFLVYAVIRSSMAEVAMDAQRSVLLHVTGVAVAGIVVLGIDARQRRMLFWLLFADLLLIGVYGLVNHLVWGSANVLWAPRYEQYAGRATGPYFCPDHFSGAMELLLCLAIGIAAQRRQDRRVLGLVAVAAVVAVIGVVLSQSRGGGLTVIVLLGAAMIWAVAQWSRAVRWNVRLIVAAAALLLVLGLWEMGGGYVRRFSSYSGWRGGGQGELLQQLGRTCRGRMYAGAWRAWRSAPWFGIGPGMHQHLWPHFAASPDGDREEGVWPTLVNTQFHSYEVHSDWLQLLEEYGVVGFGLFLVPCVVLLWTLSSRVFSDGRAWDAELARRVDVLTFSVGVSGCLALVALGFHSLGDFNLQMPGTVWMLAVILAIPLGVKPKVEIRESKCLPNAAGQGQQDGQGGIL
jgi:O-antigen ligase